MGADIISIVDLENLIGLQFSHGSRQGGHEKVQRTQRTAAPKKGPGSKELKPKLSRSAQRMRGIPSRRQGR